MSNSKQRSRQIAFTPQPDLDARLDAYAKSVSGQHQGLIVSRSAVVRMLVEIGLQHVEAAAKPGQP